jgi:hypothetical protein
VSFTSIKGHLFSVYERLAKAGKDRNVIQAVGEMILSIIGPDLARFEKEGEKKGEQHSAHVDALPRSGG